MEWAAGNLVAQDWPADNLFLQQNAKKRVASLATTLKSEKRDGDAHRLEEALKRLNQRDLIVQLTWESVRGPAELELTVKEPSGSICNLEQKQSPGGGVMIGYNLTDKDPSAQYVAARAFRGEYEIAVRRIYGQPLGNRARIVIIQNAGTAKESRRIEVVRLDQNSTIKLTLGDGRRTELATISSAAQQRTSKAAERDERSAFHDLRAAASPNLHGASGPRGGAGTPGLAPAMVATLAAKDKKSGATAPIAQNAVVPAGGGVQMTTQVRLSADQRNLDLVIRPFFQTAAAASQRPAVTLPVIPGGN
jgi:hypothetical protein